MWPAWTGTDARSSVGAEKEPALVDTLTDETEVELQLSVLVLATWRPAAAQ